MSGKFDKDARRPQKSRIYDWEKLKNSNKNLINRLTPKNGEMVDSLKRWEKYFLTHMISYLKQFNLPIENITFVYGDTHDGGWGTYKNIGLGIEDMRIYNTGAWVAHNIRHHPPCHIFFVDMEGNEYLFDISFRGVKVDGTSLLKLASDDTENRIQSTSRLFRFLVKFV